MYEFSRDGGETYSRQTKSPDNNSTSGYALQRRFTTVQQCRDVYYSLCSRLCSPYSSQCRCRDVPRENLVEKDATKEILEGQDVTEEILEEQDVNDEDRPSSPVHRMDSK